MRGWIAGVPNECLGAEVLLVVRGVSFEALFLAPPTVDLPATVWECVLVEGTGGFVTDAAGLSTSALGSIFASASMTGFGSSAGGTDDGPDGVLCSRSVVAVLG